MKKFFWAVILLVALLTVASHADDGEAVATYTWDMSIIDYSSKWSPWGGEASVEDGIYTLKSTSTDLYITNLLKTGGIKAEDYPFFAIKYKTKSTKSKADIFWTNSTYPKFTDKAVAIFDIVPDNTWQVAILDLRDIEKHPDSWAGDITSVRIDPVNPSTTECKINISRIGFFKTREEAAIYLSGGEGEISADLFEVETIDASWDMSRESERQMWTLVGGTSTVEAGVYNVFPTTTDIQMHTGFTETKLPALAQPYFAIKYKSKAKATKATIFFTNDSYASFTDQAIVKFDMVRDNQWQDLIIDCREFEKNSDSWAGNIKDIRFDPINPSAAGEYIYISRMGFFESEEAAKAYLNEGGVQQNFDKMTVLRGDMQVAYIPGGILADGYDKEDYLVKDVTVSGNVVMYNENGTQKPVALSDVNAKGFVTFSPERAAEYYLGTGGKEYADTSEHWAKEYIDYTSVRELFGGTSPTEFSPDMPMTRGMFITVLGRLCRADGTTDGMYYDPYINWSIEKGYADVTDAQSFRPEKAITRLEMAKFINNYLNDCEYTLSKCNYDAFSDTASLNDAEKAAVENVRAYGIINGKDNNMFDPTGLLTRAETATVMTRLIKAMLGVNVNTTYTAEYIRRDRIKIGTKGVFDPLSVNEKYMQTVADCGFDWITATSAVSTGDALNTILDFCDRNAIEVYVYDKNIAENPDSNADAEYYMHPSYTGAFIADEPGIADMEAIAQRANKYLALTGRDPHINLLPMYANAAQLQYGAGAAAIEYYNADPELYYKHVSTWAQLTDADYICTDIYPLNTTDTYSDYIESINIFARAARDYNKEFYAYIQAYGWRESKRNPSAEDFRWQIYSMLSFGCKGINFWAYGSEFAHQDYALVNKDGTPTEIYYAAQTVISEIKNLSDVYCTYNNIGAFNVNCTDDTPYLKMSNPVEFTAVKVDTTAPLLVGCFEAKEGTGKAVTLVNMHDPLAKRDAEVNFTLDGYTKATAYIKGEPVVLTANNGVFSVSLEYGEGIFVTLE